VLSDGSTRDDLLNRLKGAIPPERVLTTVDELRPYSHDASPVSTLAEQLGRHDYLPDVVVRPHDETEVVRVVQIAAAFETPMTTRGLGSSVTGQPLPVHGGMVVDLSALVGPPQLDETNHLVTVPAGVRGGDLEDWLSKRDLTLNHFPQSLPRSTVGGWLATRATGQFSSRYGGIESLVSGYRVVLADGSVVDVRSRPRSAVGPDLRALFLGSEGTLGLFVEVTLRVFDRPPRSISRAYSFPDVGAGLECMRAILHAGLRPSLMRFYDEAESRHAAPNHAGHDCVMFLTHEGLPNVAEAEAAASAAAAKASGARELAEEHVLGWYRRRFDFSAVEGVLATAGGFAETIEVAHYWSGIRDLYDRLRQAVAPFADDVWGHFSHVYDQGVSLYVIVTGRAATDAHALERVEQIWRTAMAVTLACGGEISHHHGAGLTRQPYVRQALGGQHAVLRRLKTALDARNLLNPGKLALDDSTRSFVPVTVEN
jgi:alkyldihydroxyacetonephosphate synthase